MLPLSDEQLTGIISRLDIPSLTEATIRQVVAVTTEAEKASGEKYMHLELGNPGLPSQQIGVEAECEALRNGIANKYPPVMGTTALKNAASRFVKAFLDVDIPGNCIVPSVGSMQGSFSLMLLLGRRDPAKDTMLYLDPGFAPQHLQAQILGLKQTSFDIYDYRGEALAEKLESILAKGNITGILYSNPNNPAWTNLTPDELASIGRLATKYDAIVIEDLAYMGMDFRHDCGTPFEEPYVPTIAKYTDNYVLLLSASKIFSYAGERIALVCMSPEVARRTDPGLMPVFRMRTFADAYIFGVVYCVSSGVTHSVQCAMAAMLEAAADGRINFVHDCEEYRRRCARARQLFTDAGFKVVYADDAGTPVSDGFFFTATYGDMDSESLQRALMRHGISTISLPGTGSTRHGLRICVSKLADDKDFEILAERLRAFTDEQQH
ncbi:MAG: pyridoxal phosphate-dependent aminotransferase [Muribaculaceae bacterium]